MHPSYSMLQPQQVGGLPLRKPAGCKQSLLFQSSANFTTFCICIPNSSSLLN